MNIIYQLLQAAQEAHHERAREALQDMDLETTHWSCAQHGSVLTILTTAAKRLSWNPAQVRGWKVSIVPIQATTQSTLSVWVFLQHATKKATVSGWFLVRPDGQLLAMKKPNAVSWEDAQSDPLHCGLVTEEL